MSDLPAIQLRVSKLIELALRSPAAEEGRNAALAACRLIRDSGLLIVRPDELVTFVTKSEQPVSGSVHQPETKKTRKKRAKKSVSEIVMEGTDGFVTAVDAAGRIVSSVNSFRSAVRRTL